MMHDTLMGEIRWLLAQSETPLSRADLLNRATLTDSGDEVSATLNWMGNKTSPPQIERYGKGGKGDPFRYALTEAGREEVAEKARDAGEQLADKRPRKPRLPIPAQAVTSESAPELAISIDGEGEADDALSRAVMAMEPETAPPPRDQPDEVAFSRRPPVIAHQPPAAPGWEIDDHGDLLLYSVGEVREQVELPRERAVLLARMILACDQALGGSV